MTFYPLVETSLLYDGYQKSFLVAEISVLVVQQCGRVSVVENRCPHMDAPLDYSTVSSDRIRCPLHGMEFCLRDGRGLGPAAHTGGIEVFTVITVDEFIGISI